MRKMVVYLLGLGILVVAAYVLLTQTEVANFVPAAVVAAILLVIVGLGLMGLADEIPDRQRVYVREVERDYDRDEAPVRRRERYVHDE